MSFVRIAKPQVLTQIGDTGHVLIEASAGTGKTYTIEHLVLDVLLCTEITLDQILVVTFTDKATIELRTRVREAIERVLATAPQDSVAEDVPHWLVDDKARERLEKARDKFDAASISTIHGFCRSILRDRAFASQRFFTEEQISFDDAFTRAFYDALRDEFALDPLLSRALSAWLAGGDSIEKLESSLRELAKAKGDIIVEYEPVEALRAATACLPAIERWYGFVNPKTGTGKADKLHLDQLKTAIEKAVATSDPFSVACENELKNGDTAYLVGRIGKLATLPDGIRDELTTFARQTLHAKAMCAKFFLPIVLTRMDERKRAEGLYDYDDMLTLVRQALRKDDGGVLSDSLRTQYRIALIDEFQDTDDVQWEIFKRLFFDESEGHRLFLVGDPKQAIYGFRGADIATYRRASEEVIAHGGRLLHLAENFRSSKRMIDACHRVFGTGTSFFSGHNHYDFPVTAGANAPRLLDANRNEMSAFVVHDFAPHAITSSRAMKTSATTSIADDIASLLDPANPPHLQERGGERPLRAKDIYVLTFNGKESAAVGRELRRRGIPYAFFKQEGLFQTDEARDIFDLLAAIETPRDRGRLSRALLTPFFNFELTDLSRESLQSGEHPATRILESYRKKIDDKAYAAFFSAILEESGVIRRAVFESDERALTNYQQLAEQLMAHAQASRATIGELVRTLWSYITEQEKPPGDEADMQRLQSDRDAVQIMTVHKSKGLEAAVVFLFGGYFAPPQRGLHTFHESEVRKIWPGRATDRVKAQAKTERDEELQRLLYVALTRAKGRFVLHSFGDARMTGSYSALHAQLGTLRNENAELFEWRAAMLPTPDDEAPSHHPALALGADWPSPFQLGSDESRAWALKLAHRAPLMTSYSRIARAKSNDERPRLDDRATELLRVESLSTPSPDLLPPGINTGLFLHELLELADLDALRTAKTLAKWSADPRVGKLIASSMRRFSIEPRHRAHAERVVYEAMTREIQLGAQRIDGLASATQHLREPEFIYPIPESAHPLLSLASASNSRFAVERGYVKGYIDLIFEHEGRSYVLDWKSDTLASYDAASVSVHADANYGVQARLYAIALARMLQIKTAADYERTFGGLVYFFLRSSGQEGVYFTRPTFAQLCTWENELVAREQWG